MEWSGAIPFNQPDSVSIMLLGKTPTDGRKYYKTDMEIHGGTNYLCINRIDMKTPEFAIKNFTDNFIVNFWQKDCKERWIGNCPPHKGRVLSWIEPNMPKKVILEIIDAAKPDERTETETDFSTLDHFHVKIKSCKLRVVPSLESAIRCLYIESEKEVGIEGDDDRKTSEIRNTNMSLLNQAAMGMDNYV
jgi:hypothetical protein